MLEFAASLGNGVGLQAQARDRPSNGWQRILNLGHMQRTGPQVDAAAVGGGQAQHRGLSTPGDCHLRLVTEAAGGRSDGRTPPLGVDHGKQGGHAGLFAGELSRDGLTEGRAGTAQLGVVQRAYDSPRGSQAERGG